MPCSGFNQKLNKFTWTINENHGSPFGFPGFVGKSVKLTKHRPKLCANLLCSSPCDEDAMPRTGALGTLWICGVSWWGCVRVPATPVKRPECQRVPVAQREPNRTRHQRGTPQPPLGEDRDQSPVRGGAGLPAGMELESSSAFFSTREVPERGSFPVSSTVCAPGHA